MTFASSLSVLTAYIALAFVGAIVLGIIPDDDQVEDRETGQLIWKGPNLVRFRPEFTEEPLQQVR